MGASFGKTGYKPKIGKSPAAQSLPSRWTLFKVFRKVRGTLIWRQQTGLKRKL